MHILAKLNRELGMTIQVVAHDLNMLLPILTGAVYLLDGHPHFAKLNEVLDSKLLTHLYGTQVQVVTTPQETCSSPRTQTTSDATITQTCTPRLTSHNSITMRMCAWTTTTRTSTGKAMDNELVLLL